MKTCNFIKETGIFLWILQNFYEQLFCRTPVVTASLTFKVDIHLAKLIMIIENKADLFSIKNKNITFENVKSNSELQTRNICYIPFILSIRHQQNQFKDIKHAS